MQIILLEKIAKLGQLGDVVDVKNGYARNYLIPQKKAQRATKANLADFEARRAELEKAQADLFACAQARAAALDGLRVTVKQKAGVDGRLFGSVTNHDIADALTATGQAVVKSEIRLPEGPFKAIGEYSVVVSLHHDVIATIALQIAPEA